MDVDNWVKALGMGVRGQQLPDHWEDIDHGLFHRAVTFSRRPSMKAGEGIVLYASGTGLIFAVGHVTSYPYKQEAVGHEAWPWRVNIDLAHYREFVHDGVALEVLNVEDRDLRTVMKRRSHARLSDAEYAAAVAALK